MNLYYAEVHTVRSELPTSNDRDNSLKAKMRLIRINAERQKPKATRTSATISDWIRDNIFIASRWIFKGHQTNLLESDMNMFKSKGDMCMFISISVNIFSSFNHTLFGDSSNC